MFLQLFLHFIIAKTTNPRQNKIIPQLFNSISDEYNKGINSKENNNASFRRKPDPGIVEFHIYYLLWFRSLLLFLETISDSESGQNHSSIRRWNWNWLFIYYYSADYEMIFVTKSSVDAFTDVISLPLNYKWMVINDTGWRNGISRIMLIIRIHKGWWKWELYGLYYSLIVYYDIIKSFHRWCAI